MTAPIAQNRMASFGGFRLGGRRIDAWSPDELWDYCEQYNVGWVVCWSPPSRYVFDTFFAARRVATIPRFATSDPSGSNLPGARRAIASRAGGKIADRYMAEGERHYALYRIERPRSFFIRGRGRFASVGPNRIELGDVVPDRGSAVLSLHWLDTWRTDPPLPIEATFSPGDPVPFVRIWLR